MNTPDAVNATEAANDADPVNAADALADVATIGPFFATNASAGPGWQRMARLVDDPRVITARIDATAAALAGTWGLDPASVEPRVAASITQLGLVGRLLAPVLAVAVVTGLVLDADLGRVWWQPRLGGPYPLAFIDPQSAGPLSDVTRSDPDERVERFDEAVLGGAVAAINAAVVRVVPLADGLVRGNVASALAGAAKMIALARPDEAARAHELVAALLRRPSLAGSGSFGPGGFRRTSCCLIYRLSEGGGYCGDCALG